MSSWSRIPSESGFWSGVGVFHLKETVTQVLSFSSGLLCNFVAVYLTCVQFILRLKLCLYTIVHLLLEEFKNFSQVILKYTIIMSYNNT